MRNPSVSTGRPPSEPHDTSQGTQPSCVESRPTVIDNADDSAPRVRHGPDSSKPKRVRTGCLTCRERHLKCDEASPRCQNCSKSGRICKRGIRLNFIDTQTVSPPHYITPRSQPIFTFQDESREIASEYEGGFERYPSLKQDSQVSLEATPQFDFPDVLNASVIARQSLPVSPSILPSYPEAQQTNMTDPIFSEPSYVTSSFTEQSTFLPKQPVSSSNVRTHISTPEEALLMQVFVEEVGLWMDSMDAQKHFTEKLPFHALGEPMLLNSILACGARHLHLVNPTFSQDRASHYYNAASRDLLSRLQDPNRDSVLCATTAVILNCYEVMSENTTQRMNHIAGARALIKECRWNGKSPGVGGACFWLNVGMELLSCLHFDWQIAWDPDTWGIDIESELVPSQSLYGDEELWTHRMVYICAKIANYRTSSRQNQESSDRHAQAMRLQQQCHEWDTYKRWCDEWASCIPRSMVPVSYLQPWQTTSKSAFPEVWLIRRTAIVGRLFYHTSCILLAKCHPVEAEFSTEMRDMQQRHAHDLCGIVAHVKDRGVATMSIRCLAIAAECLVTRDAQEEILDILDKIMKEAGWRIESLKNELREKWGWGSANNHPHSESASTTTHLNGHSVVNTTSIATPSRDTISSGIVNPLMATADFSMPNHPYQDHYVAPQTHLGSYNYPSY